ncbi:MAG TPA: MOSC domain-containing protein [Acidimicrobiia bacterium]|jgi:MOSC domain-containing protein YiiM|nr:MOSC domain-containing protein [Acidimicrobiia bacterium]
MAASIDGLRRPMIEVVAVNVGTPEVLFSGPDGERVYSSIAKRAVPFGTALWLSSGNLAGDAQADLAVHGGPDKAVYAYPSEHLAGWTEELGGPLGAAAFGENLSTLGVVEVDVRIGDVWKWGDAFLQVSQPRWPCFKLALHRRRRDVQQRMRTSGRTGWYLRVVQPGEVVAGSAIEISHRDPAGLTVEDAHLAMGDRHLDHRARTEALAEHDALAEQWREPLQARLDESTARS